MTTKARLLLSWGLAVGALGRRSHNAFQIITDGKYQISIHIISFSKFDIDHWFICLKCEISKCVRICMAETPRGDADGDGLLTMAPCFDFCVLLLTVGSTKLQQLNILKFSNSQIRGCWQISEIQTKINTSLIKDQLKRNSADRTGSVISRGLSLRGYLTGYRTCVWFCDCALVIWQDKMGMMGNTQRWCIVFAYVGELILNF